MVLVVLAALVEQVAIVVIVAPESRDTVVYQDTVANRVQLAVDTADIAEFESRDTAVFRGIVVNQVLLAAATVVLVVEADIVGTAAFRDRLVC